MLPGPGKMLRGGDAPGARGEEAPGKKMLRGAGRDAPGAGEDAPGGGRGAAAPLNALKRGEPYSEGRAGGSSARCC